jgi:hypothetical protein
VIAVYSIAAESSGLTHVDVGLSGGASHRRPIRGELVEGLAELARAFLCELPALPA